MNDIKVKLSLQFTSSFCFDAESPAHDPALAQHDLRHLPLLALLLVSLDLGLQFVHSDESPDSSSRKLPS